MEITFSQEAIGQGDAKSTSQCQKDEDGCEDILLALSFRFALAIFAKIVS